MTSNWIARPAFAAALLCAGCASNGALNHGKLADDTTYDRYAGAPIRQFVTFGLKGWEDVGPNKIVIWNGVNEAYLLSLGGICSDLHWSQAIQVRFRSHTVSRFDYVSVGPQDCSIDEIRPLDIRRMKAERASGRNTLKGTSP